MLVRSSYGSYWVVGVYLDWFPACHPVCPGLSVRAAAIEFRTGADVKMAENQPENFDVSFESIQARQPSAHFATTPAIGVACTEQHTHWLRAEPKAHHLSPSAQPHTGHMCGT